jgi:hypothetical protein
MAWFNFRKKKEEVKLETSYETPREQKCSHLWCDFPPYLEFWWTCYRNEYNKRLAKEKQLGWLSAEITESYVCCKCSERDDKVLYRIKIEDITRNDALVEIERIKKDHKDFCKPRAEVEDKISDLQHKINRDLLRSLSLYNPAMVGSNFPNDLPILNKFLKGDKNE